MDDFAIGRELTAITMGIDAFERRNAGGDGLLDDEGLVPIYMGKDIEPGRDYADWDAPRRDLDALTDTVAALPESGRKSFLEGMVASLKVAIRLFAGGTPSFDEKVRNLVGAPVGRVAEEDIAGHRERLDRHLSASGFGTGTLIERVKAWQAARAVETDDIQSVFDELMTVAKARTADRIFDTGDYTMALNPLRDIPFSARCNFNEGQMDLNVDLAFTRAALKHLVCHEVFPGHSTQLLATRAAVDAGEAPLDALLITANAITGCVQEGIGDQGVQLIDWVEDADDAVYLELRSLQSAVQTSGAWMLMAEGLPADEVAHYLRETGMGQEAWVQGRLRMASHPFRGPFIASYWGGNEAVRKVRETVTEAEWPAFVTALYKRAQSPESIARFREAA